MLASQIEVRKLSTLLDQPASSLADLTAYPPEALRQLRHLCEEKCFASDRSRFHRWAQWSSLVPPPLMAVLARRAGPLLTARIATEMPSHRGAAIARRLPAPFLAKVCQHLDPQRSRELIRELPPTLLVDTALTLIDDGAFMLLGRVADALEDDATRAVMDAVVEDGNLLRIALFMESRTRLDHLVRLLPRERLARAVLLATDPDNDLMLEVIALLGNLGYELKHQLGDLVANQPATVLARIIQVAEQHQLWPDLVPVIAELSPATQQRLLELPVLRQQPEILGHIITAADRHGLWSRLLPLVGMMDPGLLQEVGNQAAMLDRAAIERAMEAALTTEQWHALVRVAQYLPAQRQQDIAEIIDAYGKVDPALRQRLVTLAKENGLQALFA